MKIKKFEKTLVLNKKTVANLKKEDMKKLRIRGGGERGGGTEHGLPCI